MSRIYLGLTLAVLLLYGLPVAAQHPGKGGMPQQGGIVKGDVKDALLGTPVEYSTISVFSKRDSSLVNGTITDAQGVFKISGLRPGRYYVEVTFIGYHKKRIDNIAIGSEQLVADLQTILLEQAVKALGEVTVTTDRPVQYKIDKKVIPVSRYHTATSGTAVDVLENVPSVSVDIEGNVSLRGSTAFTVLIDGRPTILDANEALEQIPASVIENIEIITNPSAKYDPDGTAGIINIITKKGKLKGTSGVANLNVGRFETYGGDMLWNYRKKKFNTYVALNYNNRNSPGYLDTWNSTIVNDTTNTLLSKGAFERERKSFGIRGGMEFQLDTANLVSLGFRYGKRSAERKTTLNYEERNDPGGAEEFYTSDEITERKSEFISANLDIEHSFRGEGHKLTAQVLYSYSDGEEESVNQLFDDSRQVTSGQKSTEDGPGERLHLKADYTLPLGNKEKFEAGYQAQFHTSEDLTKLFEYDTVGGGYILQPEFSNDVTYIRNVHSIYTIYVGEQGKLGYQLGVRGEYTNRDVELEGEGERFTIDRWDIFPTIHTEYSFSDQDQVMASYTRRIQRPRSWYLEPFIVWTDAFNVRRGNPGLKPEYIDSYELGYIKHVYKHLFSVEGYYRVTHNKIERVRNVFEENVMLSTIENIGKDYTLGAELLINLQVSKWLRTDIIGNFYNYRQEGELLDQDFSQESFNWSMRNNNTFRIGNNTRLQWNFYYNSATDWAQGRRKGFFISSASLRREFFDKKLTATLQVRDLFGTMKHETTFEGVNFFSRRSFGPDTPIVMLNLSLKINNYKKQRTKPQYNGNGDDEGDEF